MESKIFPTHAIIWKMFYCSGQGFPDSSVGEESACNAGDPSSISGSGRSARDGIGYPLHYSWASLAAQLVKNLPAMQETWVWSLDWEDPLEEEMVIHSSILAWEIHGQRSLAVSSPWVTESDTTEWLSLFTFKEKMLWRRADPAKKMSAFR